MLAVVSDMQSAGVGSRDNSWQSLDGNLFLSFCIPLEKLPKDLKIESASIYFAYILKETLALLGSKLYLKWPNDFYIGQRKVGGMITTLLNGYILCGVGINLKSAPEGFAKLDIEIEREKILKEYFANIEKFSLWKQVFSKYRLEFRLDKDFYVHTNNNKIQLKKATLEDDGSLRIDGERIYSLR